MLLSADWILPGLRRPIRDGAVLVRDGHVVDVGRRDELVRQAPDDERRHFDGCVLTPGLVNAHTHLSLSALHGLLAPSRFEEWLPRLGRAMSDWGVEDYAASAALGVRQALAAGTTVVGDIVYGPESAHAAAVAGVGGVFYWEVLGVGASELFAELERHGFPRPGDGECGARIRCGLSPHSTYTSGPALLRAAHEAAGDLGVPLAIHVAESAAEVEFTRTGGGPLSEMAARLAADFVPTGEAPVAYLDRLGVLDGVSAVHLCQLAPTDVARLASTVRGAISCPRSNRFLSNRVPPVGELVAAGVPVGLGTDSTASNTDLDLMAEVRALQASDPTLEPAQLVRMVTTDGAVALGCEDRFGMLEPGMEADVAVFRLGAVSSPESEFVARAGADTLDAVMTAGKWRVLDGRPVDEARARAVEQAAERSAEKARAALA